MRPAGRVFETSELEDPIFRNFSLIILMVMLHYLTWAISYQLSYPTMKALDTLLSQLINY